MITVDQLRDMLGDDMISDQQLEDLRGILYQMARILVENHLKQQLEVVS